MEGIWHLWFPLQHWLAIHTGTINESGPYYGFFSGFGSDLGEVTIITGLLAVYKKHNCHVRWCWRFAHHDLADHSTGITYRLCRKHHPAHPGRKPVTARMITEIAERAA